MQYYVSYSAVMENQLVYGDIVITLDTRISSMKEIMEIKRKIKIKRAIPSVENVFICSIIPLSTE